jgi:GT2 family glycosyltransferase
MIQLSIIVVTWNCRQFIPAFVESLGDRLNDPTTQILVIDNDSADGTADLIEQNYPQIELVRTGKNLGFSRGNNLGLSLAKGDWIALVNPDVKVLPGCIDSLMDWMEHHPDIGLIGPRMFESDGIVHRSTMRFPTAWNCFCDALALHAMFPGSRIFQSYHTKDFPENKTEDVDVLNGWFWLTRRSALDAVGPLDESFFMYGEDIDWCRRFGDAGWKRVYFAGAASIHYGGGSSSNAPIRFYVEQQRALLQYFSKHHNLANRAGLVASLWVYHLARVFGHGLSYLTPGAKRESPGPKIRRSVACIRWLMGFTHG